MENLIWIGGGIAVILLVIGVIVTISGERSDVDERLERYAEGEADLYGEEDGEGTSVITDWLNVRVEKSSFGDRIARELARADMKFKPGEYLAIIFFASFFLGFVGWILGGREGVYGFVFAGIGLVAGPFIPRYFVRRSQKRRLERFVDQLPDMLNLMVNGLRAGYSQMQSLEAVSKELPSPISDEFRRVVREIQLGLTIEQSLDNLLRRIPSPDLDFIITAINIQRESGGNLAEILEVISYTIRERIRIKREIQVLVAQVLYSGRILAFMPLALAGGLWVLNREYMNQFFLPGNRLCGIPLLICGALMIYAGYIAMNKVADIDV